MHYIFSFLLLFFSPILSGEPTPPLSPELEQKTESHPYTEYFPAGAENDYSTDRFFGEAMHMFIALGAIIGFLLIASWFVKRMLNTQIQQINDTSRIKIHERRTLSAKTSLYLLEVENNTVLIGESPAGVSLLGYFPQTEKQARKSFESLMSDRDNLNRE